MRNRLAFLAAPLLATAYGLIRLADGADGERGPGLAWTAGHLAFLAALLLFVPILLELRRLAGGGRSATVAAVVGLVGAVLSMAQFGIDIAVGAMAGDHAAMGPLFDDVQAVPGVQAAVYVAGPPLFYLGLLLLVGLLAARRAAPVWAPVAVVVSVLASSVNLDLMPLGGLALLVAFVPFLRPAPSPVAA